MTDDILRAVEILRAGGLVAFPTETVYGLGADASNAAAIARLYAVKRRPVDHPVIVHFAADARAFEWVREVPEAARRLAARFWPGPLTLILKRATRVGDFVSGGQDTIGVRVPSHPVARAMLEVFGGGVAAPSANRFGKVSATTAAHVREELGQDVDLVLEGGPSEIGIESTIVDLSRGKPVMLRPGAISAAELEAVLAEPLGAADLRAPRAPGTLERHYAPRTRMRLVAAHALDAEIAKAPGKAVLAFSRPDERVGYWLRMPREAQAYARRLYAALREIDTAGSDEILVESPPEAPEWTAVLDRLRRATSPREGS